MKHYMYSDEGDTLVAQAIDSIRSVAENEGAYISYGMLKQLAKAHMREIASAGHSEVYDTEPRNSIADALDEILATATGQECHQFDWF
jgi:hypothetical protein